MGSEPRKYERSFGSGRPGPRAGRRDMGGRPGGRGFDRRGLRPGGFRSRGDRPPSRAIPSSSEKSLFRKTLEELSGSRSACIFDSNSNMLGRVPIGELLDTLRTLDNPYAVILDGRVDSNLNSLARMKGVKFLIGKEKESLFSPVTILDGNDLK